MAFGGFLRKEILETIIKNIDEALERPPLTVSEATIQEHANKLLVDFDEILNRRWHLIEPTQIVTFEPNGENERTAVVDEDGNSLLEDLLSKDIERE